MNMIGTQASDPSPQLDLARLMRRLAERGFCGNIDADRASRDAPSTDNSGYQITPDVIIAPRDAEDLRCVTRVLDDAGLNVSRVLSLRLCCRGG
ncbi:hypothetical protein [Shinella oryzae]|uniref:hypothetical protein n=1 Tax=Shinella oryzae TaxID=2871820 RepID=UPI001FF2AC48|nr:hypothetical protein [Shinella oryzae]UPA26834.1 hypothetical protein K6301_23190 [Shinella oryzae]